MKDHCAIYIRKSREDKNKPAHRLTVQREQLPAYAASQGWTISTYDDGHASAARGKTEALLQRSNLEQDIRAGKINIVLVIELSRLSRDDTLADYLAWLNLCAEHHVKLATMSRVLDPSQHSDWMLLLMEGGFSSVEMKVLRGRMEEGRQQAFQAGKWLGGSPPPPYIYSKDQRRPIIDPVQLRLMQQLWALAETTSAKQIACALNMPEIAVRRAISDERLLIYQAQRLNPGNGETIHCDWEPVMDAEQADRIRVGRRTRKTNIVRREAAGLLSAMDILFCGHCGRTVKTWNNSKIRKDGTRCDYYGCQTKNQKNACPKSRMISQSVLDEKILINIFGTISHLDKLQEYWEQSVSETDLQPEMARLTETIKNLVQQKSNLVEAIAAGIIEFADAKTKMGEIAGQLKAAEKAKRQLLTKLQRPTPDWKAMAFTRADFESLDIIDQRTFIKTIVTRIKVFQSYATIEYPFPRSRHGDHLARIHLQLRQKRQRGYKS